MNGDGLVSGFEFPLTTKTKHVFQAFLSGSGLSPQNTSTVEHALAASKCVERFLATSRCAEQEVLVIFSIAAGTTLCSSQRPPASCTLVQ